MIQVFYFAQQLEEQGATDQNDDKIWRTIFVKSRGFFFFFAHLRFEILSMFGVII